MKYLILILSVILFSGCATSSVNYVKPNQGIIINQITVSDEFDIVWDRLVKNLSSDFFVINNIEKNSRIINVSFLSNEPSQFVDCGTTTRTFKNARGEQEYIYNPADSTVYMLTNNAGHAFTAKRNSRLEGRANIYVAPNGKTTDVSVNTKYVIDTSISYTNVHGQPAGVDNTKVDFSSKSPYVGKTENDVSCVAKGSLEQRILSYAK